MSLACLYCLPEVNSSESRTGLVRIGSFKRSSDQKTLQRYKCKSCLKTFSEASKSRCFMHKKRQIHASVFECFASGLSQRRMARILKVNRKTIARKLIFLGENSLECLKLKNRDYLKSQIVEFDDLETFEHTKCKPLSVTMAVEHKSRRILGFKVARMPAKGLLAAISRKKYGYRVDERGKKRSELFEELREFVEESALFKSDQHPGYPTNVKGCFPKAEHKRYKGRKGCVTGQGELKSGGFDPLFTLNHSFAMFRANISRLFRRTWNTTKDPKMLSHHIAIYALYHNLVLLKK